MTKSQLMLSQKDMDCSILGSHWWNRLQKATYPTGRKVRKESGGSRRNWNTIYMEGNCPCKMFRNVQPKKLHHTAQWI